MQSTSTANPYRNDDAERALLGSLFIKPESFDNISWLRAESFGNKLFGAIFAAISTCARMNEPIDLLIVSNRLREAGVLEAVGGLAGLTELMESVPTGVYAAKYADLVHDAHSRRILRDACTTALDKLGENSENTIEVGKSLSVDVDLAIAGGTEGATPIREIASRQLEHCNRIQTGFPAIDTAINGGIAPTDFFVVGARPKVGKSHFALQTIVDSEVMEVTGELRKARALLVSLEMSQMEVECRLISRIGQIPLGAVIRLRSNQAKGSTISAYGERFAIARESVKEFPIYIYDKPINIFNLQALISRHRHDIDFVVLDYLQLLGPTYKGQKDFDRVSEAARSCKTLAQRYSIPILAVSQLKRNDDRRPVIADLRSSGQIEQDANQIVLLHREDNDGCKVTRIEVGLCGNRSGPTFWEEMDFNAEVGIYFPKDGGMFE